MSSKDSLHQNNTRSFTKLWHADSCVSLIVIDLGGHDSEKENEDYRLVQELAVGCIYVVEGFLGVFLVSSETY